MNSCAGCNYFVTTRCYTRIAHIVRITSCMAYYTHHNTLCFQSKPSSDSGMFDTREELENYLWFWGAMNRADSEAKMREVGEIGNFAIRINASGRFVMTFW